MKSVPAFFITGAIILVLILSGTALAATINVNSTLQVVNPGPDGNGDGLCQLSEAIRAANTDLAVDGCAAGSGADTINVPAGTYTLDVADNGEIQPAGLPVISTAITITGAPSETFINRNQSGPGFSIFVVSASGALTITDMVVQFGHSETNGGAVLNLGTLSTVGVTFASNRACDRGGAVYGGGTFANSLFNGNAADCYMVHGLGGGIYGTSAVTVSNSVFTSNSAFTEGGAISCSQVTVTDSTFEGNFAVIDSGRGGAIASGEVDITRSVFRGNESSGYRGGAVDAGSGVIRDSFFDSNSALEAGGAINGGAINVSGSTFLNNSAESGGALHTAGSTIKNSTFTNNQASSSGGGLSVAEAVLNNVTVTGNSASANYGGGGIASTGNLHISNSIIAGNTARYRECWEAGCYWESYAEDCLVGPTMVSGGHNLVGNPADCGWTAGTGDQFDVDPELRAAANNGGISAGASVGGVSPIVIPTNALPAGSTAIDAGDPMTPGSGGTTCEATDQRGIARPVGAACDIGALEGTVERTADLVLSFSDSPDPVAVGTTLRYTANVSNGGPDAAEGYEVAITLPSGMTATNVHSSCSESAGIVNCTAGRIGKGESSGFWAEVVPSATGSLSASATVNPVNLDPDTENNSGSAVTTVKVTHTVTVSIAGSGGGYISDMGGDLILCSSETSPCTLTFLEGTGVEIYGIAYDGSIFHGWTGACSGAGPCLLTITGDLAVSAAFDLMPTLTLHLNVIGNGFVSDHSDYGIFCQGPGGCDITKQDWEWSSGVMLDAHNSLGWIFSSWSGACNGTDPWGCNMNMDTNKSVTATFTAVPTFPLTVVLAGTGGGAVSSSPAGISCGSTCGASFNSGTLVNLNASPSQGSVFAGWSGDCTGTSTCQLTMSAAHSVTATFNLKLTGANLSVSLSDAADPIPAGGNLSYNVTVTNGGPDAATSVVLTDSLPAGVTFVSGNPSQGSCAGASGGFTCALGNLAAGASLSFVVTVNVGASGALVNTITVSASSDDPDPSDNSDGEQTAALGVTVTSNVGGMTINAGQDATFAFTVVPDPGGFTNPVQFTCTLPPQMLHATCSFSPETVTPNSSPATSNLVVHTLGSQLALSRPATLWLAFSLVMPGLLLVSSRRKSGLLVLFCFLVLLVAVGSLAACGGSSAVAGPPNNSPRTPAGTYNVSVTAASGSFHLTHNVTVTVK